MVLVTDQQLPPSKPACHHLQLLMLTRPHSCGWHSHTLAVRTPVRRSSEYEKWAASNNTITVLGTAASRAEAMAGSASGNSVSVSQYHGSVLAFVIEKRKC